MAFSKQQKEKIVEDYRNWLNDSKAVFVLSYSKMRMPEVNAARAKLRDADGKLHVVKNRLFKRVLDESGYTYDEKFWEGNNVVVFAFEDAPSVAKALAEVTKGNEVLAVRGGYLDKAALSVKQVSSLADLPTPAYYARDAAGHTACTSRQTRPHHRRARSRSRRYYQSKF